MKKYILPIMLIVLLAVSIFVIKEIEMFSLTVIVALIYFGYLFVRFIFRKYNRINKRILRIFVKSLTIILVVPLFLIMGLLLDSGCYSCQYKCLVCRKHTQIAYFYNITLYYTGQVDYYQPGYEKWYWDNVGIKHEHDWSSLGGGRIGGIILSGWACGAGTGNMFFAAIPKLPDKDMAIAMARKIAQSSPEQRQKFLEPFYSGFRGEIPLPEGKDMKERAKNGYQWVIITKEWSNMTNEEFMEYYNAWLECYPLWK